MQNLKGKDAVSLAQRLIQFDTTNGVKPEKDCILFIKELLEDAGIETQLIFHDENGAPLNNAENKLNPFTAKDTAGTSQYISPISFKL